MLSIVKEPCCAVPEALVVIEAIPLCELQGAGASEELAQVVERIALEGVPLASEVQGLPARCASVVSCPAALSLAREVGRIAF